MKINTVVFCDDIRQEVGGKVTLVGAYTPELNASKIPVTIPVAVWVVLSPDKMGDFKFNLKIEDPDKNQILKGEIAGTFSASAITSLAIPQMPVIVSKTGTYKFSIKEDGGSKWHMLGVLKLNYVAAVMPNPTSPIA